MSERMLFRKLIQKSFGKHDISNVRVYREIAGTRMAACDPVPFSEADDAAKADPDPSTGSRGA